MLTQAIFHIYNVSAAKERSLHPLVLAQSESCDWALIGYWPPPCVTVEEASAL
ncbi:hypothetical protein KSD_06140 [Ktedonobacter sp. SOSP1-85]|nr:hypothetical protein KSD_06140 [Ktedonobacter sp. SOSP1-85]